MRWIGSDGGACAWSEAGIVRLYMTARGRRVSRQMTRDLSVKPKEGVRVHNCQFTTGIPNQFLFPPTPRVADAGITRESLSQVNDRRDSGVRQVAVCHREQELIPGLIHPVFLQSMRFLMHSYFSSPKVYGTIGLNMMIGTEV